MKNIKLLNKISAHGTDLFDRKKYNVGDNVENADAYIVRSASLHEVEFEKSLAAIARAGAGVNNIPLDKCSEKGIVVFNTPGANSNAVKELAIAALIISSRNIVQAANWVKTLDTSSVDAAKAAEKGKSQFAGVELAGKTLGVFGLGAIGGKIANAAVHLGMNVIGYDPYITIDAAWSLSRSIKKAATKEQIFAESDYITLHAALTDETRGMINEKTIAGMKDGVRIINFARGEFVDTKAICEAVRSGKVASYVTDFASNELLDNAPDGVVVIPHLGASTEESEDTCAYMASAQIIDFLENGNIKNSVNFPNVCCERAAKHRICILHKNIPNMLAQFSGALSKVNINIESMTNASKKENAYSIIETNDEIPVDVYKALSEIDGVIKAFIK